MSVDKKLFKKFLVYTGIALSIGVLAIIPFTNAQEYEIFKKSGTEIIRSSQDPARGHNTHQLAMILPITKNTWFNGTLTFEASEPIQIYEIVGPLEKDVFTSKPIWAIDGTTMYELNFFDLQERSGNWTFSANALALHTMKTEPFTVNYTIEYYEQIAVNQSLKNENVIQKHEIFENETKQSFVEEDKTMEKIKDPELENIQDIPILSPYQQIKSGISPTEVICKVGLTLIFKATNNQPTCVLPVTAAILLEREWAVVWITGSS